MRHLLILILMIAGLTALAQEKYFTKSGHISFYSHAPLEDITAENNQVAAFVNINTGDISFAVLIKSFTFEKALMQEHFNENYMDSDQFPKASFKGKLVNLNRDILEAGEICEVKVKGQLIIRGISREIDTAATLTKSGNEIVAQSEFIAKPADFNIKIPALVKDNIAKEIEVTVKVSLKPYTK